MILWVTNSLDSLDFCSDTTIRLIQESIAAGLINYICEYESIRFEDKLVVFDAVQVLSVNNDRSRKNISFGPTIILIPNDFEVIHYRVDPPVNYLFIYNLQLLIVGVDSTFSIKNNKKTRIINPPVEVLLNSEKFGQIPIPGLFPDSVISNNWETLLKFGNKQITTVLKPLNNAHGRGVQLLKWENIVQIEQNRQRIGILSENFTRPIILQEYLDCIQNGEIRMWFVNGKFLSAIKKISIRKKFIFDLSLGDEIVPYKLNKQELYIVRIISKYLKRKNIFMAAIDFIENKITDYNITSPGLLVEMEHILNINLAAKIISELKTKL